MNLKKIHNSDILAMMKQRPLLNGGMLELESEGF